MGDVLRFAKALGVRALVIASLFNFIGFDPTAPTVARI
jgi:hypothetical protein